MAAADTAARSPRGYACRESPFVLPAAPAIVVRHALAHGDAVSYVCPMSPQSVFHILADGRRRRIPALPLEDISREEAANVARRIGEET